MKANVARIAVRRSIAWSDRGQLVQDVTRLVDEVLADDPDRAAIDEIPRVDPIVTPQVQLEELALAFGRCLSVPRLEVHDAYRADADRVDRALQQALDLCGGHVLALAGKTEDLAHPDAVKSSGPEASGERSASSRSTNCAAVYSMAPELTGHGRSALRTTGLFGRRRATSWNPARSYIDVAPKNIESGSRGSTRVDRIGLEEAGSA